VNIASFHFVFPRICQERTIRSQKGTRDISCRNGKGSKTDRQSLTVQWTSVMFGISCWLRFAFKYVDTWTVFCLRVSILLTGDGKAACFSSFSFLYDSGFQTGFGETWGSAKASQAFRETLMRTWVFCNFINWLTVVILNCECKVIFRRKWIAFWKRTLCRKTGA
jgi:hypothetical protein